MIKPQIKGAGLGPKGPRRNLDKRDMNGTWTGHYETLMRQMRHWFLKNQKGQTRGLTCPRDWLSDLRITGRSGEWFRRIFPSWRLVRQSVPNWVLPEFLVNIADTVCWIVATMSRQSHLPGKIISRELWVQCPHNLALTIWGMHAIFAQYAQYTGCEIWNPNGF